MIQRLVFIVLVFPIVLRGQGAPTTLFQSWARDHVHAIAPTDEIDASTGELATIRAVTGSARVVALGEPFHGGHEPLAFRNRLIRLAVTKLGFSAVALETDLTTSKICTISSSNVRARVTPFFRILSAMGSGHCQRTSN